MCVCVPSTLIKHGGPSLAQELARDPIAFAAKEKRLLSTLKDLDVKLNRLNRDRDTALRK